MKRKAKDPAGKVKPLKPSMKKHLNELGIKNERDYFTWCSQRRFILSLDKSREQMQAEHHAFLKERRALEQHARVHHNPERFLQDACFGNIGPQTIRRPGWSEVASAIAQSNPERGARKELAAFLLHLNEKTELVFGETSFGPRKFFYIQALVNMHGHKEFWIRNLNDWVPDTYNTHGQFVSLLHHLFARYTVPEFMSTAWFRADMPSKDYRDWYLHVANGRNIRTLSLPIPFTKRMAHCFMQSPGHCSIEGAIKWGIIMAMGGDERLSEEVLGTRIAETIDNHDFWETVFRFFIDNPMLDRSHVGPIIDFLYAQKFEVRECVTAPGVVELIQPSQPNLCMKGRTPESLLRQVERWHGNLSKYSDAQKYFFRSSGIIAYRQKTGECKEDVWSIRELLSGADLIKEGKEMGHCVASYARACAAGRCSIWAMEYISPRGVEKCQTIEVNSDKKIVQVRGKRNCYPTQSEMGVIQKWAQTVGLSIAPYVRTK